MAVYLFTFHAYGSWLPDRAQGYVRRQIGVLPRDEHMAGRYRRDMRSDSVILNRRMQQIAIDAVLEHAQHKTHIVHAIATDTTHIHILIDLQQSITWPQAQRTLKHWISRELNVHIRHQAWLSRSGSHKRITQQAHFDHLYHTYLPRHRGVLYRRETYESRR